MTVMRGLDRPTPVGGDMTDTSKTPVGGNLAGRSVTAPTADQNNALAYIISLIKEWFTDPGDVEELTKWAWDQIVRSASPDEVALAIKQTEPYRREYGQVVDKRREAGLTPLSALQIKEYRNQAASLMRQAGLPQGFYDTRDDFDQYLIRDVSIAELGTRINDGYVRYLQEPEEARAEFERLYGAGAGAAYFMDPDRALPMLERQLAAASISGAAKRSGFGPLFQDEAEDAAALGLSGSEAAGRFGALVENRELFTALPGQAEDTIGRGEQIDAAIRGNAAAQRRIEMRRQRRKAMFEGGGGAASTAEGIVGL